MCCMPLLANQKYTCEGPLCFGPPTSLTFKTKVYNIIHCRIDQANESKPSASTTFAENSVDILALHISRVEFAQNNICPLTLPLKDIMPWPIGGGRPPLRIHPETVVVKVPSHDDTPCFTAYTVYEEYEDCPKFGLRVYDTTPSAGSEDRIRDLATKIHEGTEKERNTRCRSVDRDYIEVQGLPLAADVTEE